MLPHHRASTNKYVYINLWIDLINGLVVCSIKCPESCEKWQMCGETSSNCVFLCDQQFIILLNTHLKPRQARNVLVWGADHDHSWCLCLYKYPKCWIMFRVSAVYWFTLIIQQRSNKPTSFTSDWGGNNNNNRFRDE